MNFADPRVAAVFETYRQREATDHERMKHLGPAALAVRDECLLPIGKEVGAVLHALVLVRRPGTVLELGTSYGYSTLILADAAKMVGARVVSMDLADYKQDFARTRLEEAGLDSIVVLR